MGVKRRKQTRVVARRTLAERKRSLAGFRLALSLARSRASIAVFNEGRASLGFFGRRNLVFIELTDEVATIRWWGAKYEKNSSAAP